MEKIIIYTMVTCPYCKTIKEKLDQSNIKYKDKLTKDFDSEWQEITKLTGIPMLPTIEFNDEYLVPSRDFRNPDHLVQMIKTYKKSTFDNSKILLEKIKTLNHNINIAFNRTDQLLRQIETKINTDEHKSTN